MERKIEPEREDYTEPDNELSALAIDDKTILYNKSVIEDETPDTTKSKNVRIVEDKCIQISPMTANNTKSILKPKSDVKPESKKSVKPTFVADDDNRSQYISRQMEQLNKDSHRREKVKSSKEVPAIQKLNKNKPISQKKKKSRNSKSKIFDYEDVSHPGMNQDKSEERKMTPISTQHRHSRKRSETKDPSIPQPETDSKG